MSTGKSGTLLLNAPLSVRLSPGCISFNLIARRIFKNYGFQRAFSINIDGFRKYLLKFTFLNLFLPTYRTLNIAIATRT